MPTTAGSKTDAHDENGFYSVDSVENNELERRKMEMNRLYSPSQWTKRMPPDVVVNNHIAVISAASERARACLGHQLDVRYGTTDRQAYDIYYDVTTSRTDKPIVVYLHGGYWQALSKSMSSFMAEPIIKAGATLIAVDYDLCPNVSMEEIVHQTRRAITQIEQVAKQNKSSGIFLVGHSAGAHLVAMTLASTCCPDLIKGAVLVSGVYDLRPLLETSENEALKMTSEEAWILSPINSSNLTEMCRFRKQTSIIIALAENDSPPFRQQAHHFHQLLSAAGMISLSLLEVPNVDHFDVMENLQNPEYSLTRVIINLLNCSTDTASQ